MKILQIMSVSLPAKDGHHRTGVVRFSHVCVAKATLAENREKDPLPQRGGAVETGAAELPPAEARSKKAIVVARRATSTWISQDGLTVVVKG